MTSLAPDTARTLWRAFLTNATDLVDDARLLNSHGVYARSRALLVMAWCEIGRAMTLGAIFRETWSSHGTTSLPIDEDLMTDEAALTRYCRDYVVGDAAERYWGIAKHQQEDAQKLDAAAHSEACAALDLRRWAMRVTMDATTRSVRIPSHLFHEDADTEVRRTAEAIALTMLNDDVAGPQVAKTNLVGLPLPHLDEDD